MTLPNNPSQLSFSQIEGEFGQNPRRSLGKYRIKEPNVGDLGTLGLDNDGTGGNLSPIIPTDGQIAFSDFHGKSLNVVVNYWSGANEKRPQPGYQRYQANNVHVVGGFRSRPNHGNGAKVYIHVNKRITNDKGDSAADQAKCALITGGGWQNVAQLRVDVGGSGRITGGGGEGGRGGGPAGDDHGEDGKRGSSALGIGYNCDVHVKSGGIIAGGGGGGGGGGSCRQSDWHRRRAGGGGGGGGAGIDAGEGGAGGGKGPRNENADERRSYARGGNGSAGNANNGGQGDSGGNNRNEAIGGRGGNGGDLGQFGEDGQRGNGQRGERGSGGRGGHPGDSIRKRSGKSYNLYNNGTVKGPTSTGGLT